MRSYLLTGIVCIVLLCNSMGLVAQEASENLWAIPKAIEKLLLQKTGCESVASVNAVVYRSDERMQILGIEAELNRKPAMNGEAILHVRIAFVRKVYERQSVEMYSLDLALKDLISADERTLSEVMHKY